MDIQKALKLLDLEPEATLEDARAAFKKKAKQFHPDKLMAVSKAGDDGEKMKDINVAYHTLKTVLKPGARKKTPCLAPKRLPAACRHLVDAFRKWMSERHILSQAPLPRKPARTSPSLQQGPGAFEDALKQSMQRRVAGEKEYSAYARYLEMERKMKQARHHRPGTDWEVDKVEPVSRIKPVK